MYNKLLDEIECDEGYKRFIYEDTNGNKTIGIGLNLDAGMSKELARYIALWSIDDIREKLSYRLEFWNRLSRNRQDVLINMAFNLGIDGLFKFKKMLAAMSEENWDRAKYELLDSDAARELHNRYGQLAEKMENG